MDKRRVLVAGTGGAGLTAAIAARKEGAEVVLLNKTMALHGPSNCTAYSGGIFSLACGTVSPEEHYERVWRTGRGVNDPDLLTVLAKEGQEALETLCRWGVSLRLSRKGRATVRESAPTPVMGGGGAVAQLVRIAQEEGVGILDQCVVTRILTGERGVEGLEYVEWTTGRAGILRGDSVVLATGGGGQIYERTDNPARMTGDGYALALEAGLHLIDMEYVQFYPLGWHQRGFPVWMVSLGILDHLPVTDGQGREFLMEAIRSWGYATGMEANYFARDRTSTFLARHGQGGGETLLHVEQLSTEQLTNPDVMQALALGFPPERRRSPVSVSPLEHYFCGGIAIDSRGGTSIPGLFACGEVTGGVDGASRMGGNALLNIVTFGLRAGRAAAHHGTGRSTLPDCQGGSIPSFLSNHSGADPVGLRRALKGIVERYLGPCRKGEGLRRIAEELKEWRASWETIRADTPMALLYGLEMTGLHRTAEAVAGAALFREESRGTHFREDIPGEREEWRGSVRVSMSGGAVGVERGERRP